MQQPPLEQPHWTVLWKRHDGFQARLAKRFNLARQTINDWGRKGEIPTDCCAAVEEECKREFRRWHFQPDTWWQVWPELMLEPGAPAFPLDALERYLATKDSASAAHASGVSSHAGAASSPLA